MTARPFLRRAIAGIDFSSESIDAARWASRWLPNDGELVLVHALVVPEIRGYLMDHFPLPEFFSVNARADAEQHLRDLIPTLGFDKILVDVREGRPQDVLTEAARDHDADLVVVGKHGEGGSNRGYPGRTADALLRGSPAPVLLAVGMREEKPKRVVVPLTFSSITPHVVNWVRLISDRFDPGIVVVHVIGTAVLSHVLSMSAVAQGNQAMSKDEIDRVFASERDEWTKTLVDAGIPATRITSEVVFGEVAEEVRAAVARHGADMVVMGSHAGAIRRALLGSAASAVLRDAEIPVLVVVEPEENLADESTA